MLQTLFTSLKELIEIDPNKRAIIISWIFSGFIIWYLYDANAGLSQKFTDHEKNCQDMLSKSQAACEEQLRINRERNQAQINQFIEQSNMERDSIYRYFYKTIKNYNIKVSKGIKELNELKDENSN